MVNTGEANLRPTFFCLDGHTCGNPVRLVAGGGPLLAGETMLDKRQDFLEHHDWIRKALMFEPRGHDVMSGSILYPPTRPDCDIAVLFVEVSGCLPMCGHGAIGTVAMALEHGLVSARADNSLHLDTPAGHVKAQIRLDNDGIRHVRLTNVPSFLEVTDVEVECPYLGTLKVDIAYGGNFYAIIDRQPNFHDLSELGVDQLLRYSPIIRERLNSQITVQHPENPAIHGISHIMWTGDAQHADAHARNAVFYGDRAIDRSPCGTGTSARMAQWAAKGYLAAGDDFIHESIIGSHFRGRVEAKMDLAGRPAIIPSVEGWAILTGINTIFVDERDPFRHGFQVGQRGMNF